ncbi:hypothetical protein D3C76_1356970 [compost metagenome]
MQHHRDPQRPRRQPARTRDITAHPQHHVRLKAFHDRPRLTPGVENTHRRQQQGFNALAAQAGDMDKVDLNPVLRHQIGLHAVCGSQPAYLPALIH